MAEQPEKPLVEVGHRPGEVIVNPPPLLRDAKGVGYILFSPTEARRLGLLLLQHANAAEGNGVPHLTVKDFRTITGNG